MAAELASPRVLVGPNILVSRDGDVPHVELILAANPKNVKNLVGGAITATRPDGGWACRAYATADGGATWKASEFAEQVEWGGADPFVVFTPQGTAIYTALAFKKDESGRTRGFLHAYRSTDGGLSWSAANELGYSYDHEQVAVDQTTGKYSGRIYIGVLYGPYPIYQVGVFRSEDDGRSWIGPVEAANGGGKIGINDVTPMVLSDGTLVVPYGDFEMLPEKRKFKGRMAASTLWTVSSTDGGVTFSPARKVLSQVMNFDDKETQLSGFPKLAADSESKKYRDRMYVAWEDARLGNYRILFSRTTDRGKTWSAPRPLDNTIPPSAKQWQPTVAVNKDGVVAVTWYDTRDSKDGKQYHHYLAASLDGGETFLPSVRVSSALSDPFGPGNSRITPMAFSTRTGSLGLSFLSAASRWGSGGDYMGLTADKEGVFHPFWADARSGTFQVYTARVKVETPEKPESGKGEAKPPAAAPAEVARAETDLQGRVELIFDPTRYDSEKKELEIPVRLKNVSKEPIYPPMRLEVTTVGFPEYESEDDKKENAENAPKAINTSNGKEGVGAVFDLEGVLGTLEALAPGAQSGPAILRFRLVDLRKTPSLQIKVTGLTAKAP
jgi:hypothetical protein